MNQGTNLGSQIGRWIILAALVALLGALLLTIRPVGAQQTEGCNTVGNDADEKVVCYYEFNEHGTSKVATLPARELDRRQVVKVWELVTDVADPAVADPAELGNFPDYGDFRIDRKTGDLFFKSPPDYENSMSAAGADSDTREQENVYKVKAKVGDGEKFLPVEVTVQVRGIEELGTITLSNRRPEVEVVLTATLADADRGIRTPDWQWQVQNDSGGWDDIDEAVNKTYKPVEGQVGKLLRATAKYEDSHDIDYPEVAKPSEFVVRKAYVANNDPPEFQEDEDGDAGEPRTATRRIEENTAPRMKVGPPVFATDDDYWKLDDEDALEPGGPRDELTYSLHDVSTATEEADGQGHAAKFSIDQATGQITTKAPLDRESLNPNPGQPAATDYIYQVLVKATDPSGESGEITVTIHVLDEDEAPELTGPAALTYRENSIVSGGADDEYELRLDRDHALDDSTTPPTNPFDETVYKATDNDLDDDGTLLVENRDIEWQLTGPDAAKFQFGDVEEPPNFANSASIADAVAMSMALQFRDPPDVENPQDVGGTPKDNIYEVTVKAWDGKWKIGERDVTIRIADTNDVATLTLSHIQPEVGTEIEAFVNDQDGHSATIEWQWYTGISVDVNNVIAGATSKTYTPVASQTTELTVQAIYTDDGGNSETPMATTVHSVRGTPFDNEGPTFYADSVTLTMDDERIADNETSSYTRYILENKHPRNVTSSEEAARTYDDSDHPETGVLKAYDTWEEDDDNVANDTPMLQYDLSGNGAEHFKIGLVSNANVTPDEVAGLITTKRALDFEARNTYTITVKATDPSGETETATVTINVVDVPEINEVDLRFWVEEGQKVVTARTAKYPADLALGGLKWSLLKTTVAETGATADEQNNGWIAGSIDDEHFRFERFNTANTTLRFAIDEMNNAPDFENPVDAADNTATPMIDASDNVYKIVVRVEFANLRSDGDANHPNPLDNEKDDQTIWVRVTDKDEMPEFPETTEVSVQLVAENSDDQLPFIEINKDVNGTVTATDPEDSRTRHDLGDQRTEAKKLTYSLSLPAAYEKLFQVVPATGKILTRSRVDYEALELDEEGTPGAQHKTITGVTVTVTDSSGMADNKDDLKVKIEVRDVNETPVEARLVTIEGAAAVPDYAENQEDTTVGTYTISGDNAATATWSSLSGADASHFTFEGTGTSRTLKFASPPDYEMAADADGDNVYMVTIQARHDADDTDTRAVAITVTNVEEDGTVTRRSLNPSRPSVGTEITATLEDDDIVSAESWQWASSDAMDGTFTNISGATSATYTPVAADEGMYLRAMATYTDGFDSGNTAMVVSASAVSQVPVNAAPEFPSATATRTIAENTAVGTNIGAPVEATDPDGDTVTYTLEGTEAASFRIDSTGQLRTSADLNYEAKSTYTVVVRASDPAGLSDTINVTINVTDVVEVVPAIVQTYDTNGDGIDIDELFNAIDDYFTGGIITIDQLFQVIDAYFE